MATRVSGTVGLWDGWQVTLPGDCMAERNPDGSWSAWDAAHTIDVQIVTTSGTSDGRPIDAPTMLGRPPTTSGSEWVGFVEESTDLDDQGSLHRYAVAAAAENTLLSCWIAYRDAAERAWAEQVRAGLEYVPPQRSRRRLGRRSH